MAKPAYRAKVNEASNRRAAKIRRWLDEYKLSKGCVDCGYRDHHAALHFDHVRGKKLRNVCTSKSVKQAQAEIEKCEVRCANCHSVRTFARHPVKPRWHDDYRKERDAAYTERNRVVAALARCLSNHGWMAWLAEHPDAPQVDISELLGFLCNGETFAMGWWQRSDGSFSYGLRSRGDFDVSELAKRHGGGGHKNAAGFQASTLIV